MPYDGFKTANGTHTINNPFLHQDEIDNIYSLRKQGRPLRWIQIKLY